jgi:hypothetical protein
MQNLRETLNWMAKASTAELQDKSALAQWIGHAGLFYDCRTSPQDPLMSLYGDDVKYMLPDGDRSMGMWQTPLQLAGFLIAMSSQGITTYLDLGTLSGWTITVVAAYLRRFGLEHVDAVDVFVGCTPATQCVWQEFDLPITYITCDPHEIEGKVRATYDIIFIDGDHEYASVKADFETFKTRARLIAFHDINDQWCHGVVALWKEIRELHASSYTFSEFTEHPNDFDLMGIGVLQTLCE